MSFRGAAIAESAFYSRVSEQAVREVDLGVTSSG
jgi:hypothetical protein